MLNRIFSPKIAANLFWLFLNNVLIQAVNFSVGVQVIKYLGPSDYGVFVYTTILVAFFSMSAGLGLELVSVRLLVAEPQRRDDVLGSAFLLRLIASAVAYTLLILFVSIFDRGNPTVILLVALLGVSFFAQIFNVIDFFFQSQVLSKYTVWSQNVAMILCSLLRIGGILAKAPLIFFVVMGLAEAFLTALALIVAYKLRGLRLKQWKVDSELVARLMRIGWWIFVYDLAIVIQMNLDKVFIRKMLSFRDVGIYSAASSLTSLWFFLPTMIGASIFPSLVRKNADERGDYHDHLQSGFSMMTLIGLVICVAVSLNTEWLIRVLYGANYAEAGKIVPIMIWSLLFVFHVSMRTKAMIIDQQWLLLAFYAIFALAINGALNFVFVLHYGIVGGAWAYLITWGVAALFCPLLSKKTAGYSGMFWNSFNMVRNIRKVKFE